MTVTLKPATIRKVEKFLTEWQTLDVEIDRLEAKVETMPRSKWRETQKQLDKMYKRQNECRSIVIRSLFKSKEN